jgi:chemotaxis protein methyltransferase CheR
MIYFDRPLRERVHDLLYRSLSRFGILSIGKKETLAHTPFEDRFQEMGDDVRLYRRMR